MQVLYKDRLTWKEFLYGFHTVLTRLTERYVKMISV